MKSLLSEIESEALWNEFREYKLHHGHISQKDMAAFDVYLSEKAYLPVTQRIKEAVSKGTGTGLSLPEKKIINKSGTSKKRTVYCFPEEENRVLKLIGFLLYRYDGKISPACYSFRPGYTVKRAVGAVLRIPSLENKYVLKIDIRNYFNSIPADKLAEALRTVVDDDGDLLAFLTGVVSEGRAVFGGQTVAEPMGAMAGTPLSPFFADVYLSDMDEAFLAAGIPYFRYSDDVILFADSREERDEALEKMKRFLAEKGLELNPEKTKLSDPGEPWEFLGFRYHRGEIDLSEATVRKIQAKIRRKAKALYRWGRRKNANFEQTAKVMIRVFNRKFYDFDGDREFTWSRWFFPCLTVTDGLRRVDEYMLEYLRFLYSGRHYKGNYKITYEDLKSLGYHSLVHEYYKEKEKEG